MMASSFGFGGAEAANQLGLPLAYAFLAPYTPPTRAFTRLQRASVAPSARC